MHMIKGVFKESRMHKQYYFSFAKLQNKSLSLADPMSSGIFQYIVKQTPCAVVTMEIISRGSSKRHTVLLYMHSDHHTQFTGITTISDPTYPC